MRSGLLVNVRLSIVSFLRETTAVTRASCGILCFFFLLSFLVEAKEVIAMTPGHLIPPNFWIWTLVTHQFLETSIIGIVASFITMLFSVKFLETILGVTGFFIFFGVVTSLSAVLTFFTYLFIYMSTFDISYLFDVHVYGQWAYIGGVLVCLKQTKGDQMMVGSIGLNMKNLPLIYSCLLVFMKLVNLLPGPPVCLGLYGIMTAWVYLRFYQSHSKGRGDQAAHFAFKTFFPKPVQGPVGALSNAVYKFLLTVRICRKTSYRYDVGAPSKFTITLSGVDAFDAERRRNKALKALDERLQKQDRVAGDDNEWPTLDEDDKDTTKSTTDSLPSSSGKDQNDEIKIDMSTVIPPPDVAKT